MPNGTFGGVGAGGGNSPDDPIKPAYQTKTDAATMAVALDVAAQIIA
jgi:hypothetical protein